MANYVGIDLGTTNSAICSYDGANVHLYKSPEQHSVTPSAIYIGKRGRYYGARAYRMAAFEPDNSAILFKRLIGTSTTLKLSAAGIVMTPEECSAEILRVLYGYLPEDIRNSEDGGTVITVPAAFNQMQKDATLSAAQMAGIGKIAVMQEPVAAVMSIMRQRKTDGMFLVYDIGGGTFDVALAQSISGRVSLIGHGGVEMCGGRDFDRSIVDNIVLPWLADKFDLPENFVVNPKYRHLLRIATWAAEQAKVELSSKDESVISASDNEIRTKDESGEDIYYEIPLNRAALEKLSEPKIRESISATRELLEKVMVSTHDIERVVFVGGPTHYKPFRDKVCYELSIPGSTEIEPMTAVAEGAALFAESIDWQSEKRVRKSGRGAITSVGKVSVSFRYQSRTPDIYSTLLAAVAGTIAKNTKWQIDSLDSGWSSGQMNLDDKSSVKLPLAKNGENRFKVFVYDGQGGTISLDEDILSIVRTTATIDAIPASHTISVAIKEKAGGNEILDKLVEAGESLPKKGKRIWRAEESLRANGIGQIIIGLWEGEIEEPYHDNREIGAMKITGKDFDEGVIRPNDEIICEYEISDSGIISLMITIPSIGGSFPSGHNFYSRQDSLIDYATASRQIEDETVMLITKIESKFNKVDDKRLDEVKKMLEDSLARAHESSDPEVCKQAMNDTYKAKNIISKVNRDHRKTVRTASLESLEDFYRECIRDVAKPSEVTSIEALFMSAKRAIDSLSGDFDTFIDEIKNLNWIILWRQDWFVIERFNREQKEDYNYTDQTLYENLIKAGIVAVKAGEIDKLRTILDQLLQIRIHSNSMDVFESVNIVRGN